eukprot:scaffold115502_cov57-Phaeocystis_antarctica.AAC.1
MPPKIATTTTPANGVPDAPRRRAPVNFTRLTRELTRLGPRDAGRVKSIFRHYKCRLHDTLGILTRMTREKRRGAPVAPYSGRSSV